MKTNVMLVLVAGFILAPLGAVADTDAPSSVSISDVSQERRTSEQGKKRSESERKQPEDKKPDGDSIAADREQKLRLEYRARMEAERLSRLERLRRGQHYHYDPFACNSVVVVGPEVVSTAYYTTETVRSEEVYSENPPAATRSTQAIGMVFAPPQRESASAFGFEWMGPRKLGVTIWLSGRLDRGEDVIDAGIPHEDYYIESRKGTYGVQVTREFGPSDTVLVLGAGLSVRQTLYNAVSNVTGWKWNAGESYSTRLSGQIGMRFQMDDRINLHFGYDTAHYGFFGIAATF